MAGEGHQLARDVGAASYAGRLTAEARRATTDTTPLQRRIAFVVRLVMALTVLMSGAILAQAALEGFTLLRVVQTTAVLSGLVPYGLFFLIAVAYTAGAAPHRRPRRAGAAGQRRRVASATSTSCAPTRPARSPPAGSPSTTSSHSAAPTAPPPRSRSGRWPTAQRHRTSPLSRWPRPCPATPRGRVRDEVPFASSLRWSGVATATAVPGCSAPRTPSPRTCASHCRTAAIAERTGRWAARPGPGRRRPPASGCATRRAVPRCPRSSRSRSSPWPTSCAPRSSRPSARFHADGVALKVLSGDDPRTVAALAARAGLEVGEPVAGAALDGLDDPALDRLVARTTVFGRVTPEQKERIVASLRRQGRYVAMIGDGVNDARALKGAHVGVAMRSGSAVTRDVADIVLVDDSFAALLPAQREGRRIINGIAVSMYVFLARVATQGLVILAVTMLGLGFPYSPTQVGLTLLTVGIPTLFLTFWARPTPHRPASAGQPRPLRHPGRRDHRRVRHRRLRLASTSTSPKDSAPAAHRPR